MRAMKEVERVRERERDRERAGLPSRTALGFLPHVFHIKTIKGFVPPLLPRPALL